MRGRSHVAPAQARSGAKAGLLRGALATSVHGVCGSWGQSPCTIHRVRVNLPGFPGDSAIYMPVRGGLMRWPHGSAIRTRRVARVSAVPPIARC